MEAPNQETTKSHPYFSFGVIADIQYSPKPNQPSPTRVMRYYEQSLAHLQHAIGEWSREDLLPKCVLQLGDIIDRSNESLGTSEEALEKVLKEVEQTSSPFHHIWGNHELFNFTRDFLTESKLNTSCMQDKPLDEHGDETNSQSDYYAYHFSPHANFRFIVLDTFDLSVIGRNKDSQGYLDSLDFIEKADKGKDNGAFARYKANYNGGLGSKQLSWLDKVLTYCDQHNEKVIIAGHSPIHNDAKQSPCLPWNHEDILRVLHSHHCVVCYFAGHDHSGGYHWDSHGIHHVTMEGVVESAPDTNAFGTVDVYEDRMVLRGRGRVKSRVLPYQKIQPTSCFSWLPSFAFWKKRNLK